MGRNGFDFCMGIIKYGRITGTQLANASYDFMRDTLGITDENQCSKLKGEIDKVREVCMSDCALFGWGSNKYGQLGSKAMVYAQAKKIDLPSIIMLDETKKDLNSIKNQQSVLIEKIFCGNRYSGLLLSNGEFWACGNCAQASKTAITNAKGEAN